MNIFAIDPSPEIAAKNLNDQHVVKMIVESAQILSTVQRLTGNDDPFLYRPTHEKHPCILWVMESKENYRWLYRHYVALGAEYTYRYFRVHRSLALIDSLIDPPESLPNIPQTPFKQVVPKEYKNDDSVEAYRQYYLGRKIRKSFWTNRKKSELLPWIRKKLRPRQFRQNPIYPIITGAQ